MEGMGRSPSIGRVALASFAMVVAVVFVIPAALASEEITASGTFGPTGSGTMTLIKVDEEELFFFATQPGFLTGTFTGSTDTVGSLVITVTGEFSFHGRTTFTGTVNGVSGSVVFSLEFSGTGGAGGPFAGEFEIVSASGGLAGLSGGGTLQGAAGAGTYAGQIEFGD